ncbi:hypothetical protein MNBD_GAMMA01-1401 [hydrothermal vent metagenome]|uniref:Uncharacterized protein n=1 Tax=hydrothermal vent metagenome TaxID=652676 RepID=A0A3B0VQE9_9ZZZZ
MDNGGKESDIKRIIDAIFLQETESVRGACHLIHKAVDLIKIADMDLTIKFLLGVIESLPSSKELSLDGNNKLYINDKEWSNSSLCFYLLRKANKSTKKDNHLSNDYRKIEGYFLEEFISYSDGYRIEIIETSTRAMKKDLSNNHDQKHGKWWIYSPSPNLDLNQKTKISSHLEQAIDKCGNDNFDIRIVRPRPATPMDLMNYANQVIEINKRLLECTWLTEGERMHWNNQILKCKDLKKISLEYMTEGRKPNEIVMN